MNATVAAIRTRAESELSQQFAALLASLPARESARLDRVGWFDRFARAGLPNRRNEAWHFTDLRAAWREAMAPLGRPSDPLVAASEAPTALAAGAFRIALVDGHYRPEFFGGPAPQGVQVRSLDEALASADDGFLAALLPDGFREDPAVALNAAMMTGGVAIDVAPGARLERPVEIVRLTGADRPGAVYSRSIIRLAPDAKATVLETGEERAGPVRQINSVLVAALAEGAALDHVYAPSALSSPPSLQVSSFLVVLAAKARLTSTGFVRSTGFLRRQTHISFQGAQAEASLAGLSLLRGSEHVDNTLVIEHIAPHCTSRELFKHVLDEQGSGVFQGKIVVAPGAQKTDGVMASRAILMSDAAAMNNKPELEIFANEVVCAHGATCGALDRNQLFYALSRGLPRPEAEALLLEAFAAEALATIADEAVRDAISERMRAWLEQRA